MSSHKSHFLFVFSGACFVTYLVCALNRKAYLHRTVPGKKSSPSGSQENQLIIVSYSPERMHCKLMALGL